MMGDRGLIAAIEHLTAHRTNREVLVLCIGVDAFAEFPDARRRLAQILHGRFDAQIGVEFQIWDNSEQTALNQHDSACG